jgi:hypothetical protein
MSYLAKAISKLKPNAEYVITNDDYLTIQWHNLDGDAPTLKEIDNVIADIKKEEIALEQAKAEIKASAESKLSALGLTPDEIAVLRG